MQCVQCATPYAVYHYLHTDPRGYGIPYAPFERVVLATVVGLKPQDVDGSHKADALTRRVEVLDAERSRLGVDLEAIEQQMGELPPARWPKRVVVRLADLEEMIAAISASSPRWSASICSCFLVKSFTALAECLASVAVLTVTSHTRPSRSSPASPSSTSRAQSPPCPADPPALSQSLCEPGLPPS